MYLCVRAPPTVDEELSEQNAEWLPGVGLLVDHDEETIFVIRLQVDWRLQQNVDASLAFGSVHCRRFDLARVVVLVVL